MEYKKDTIIGSDSSGFSISVIQLYPRVQRDLLSQPDLYEMLKIARNEIERLAVVTGYEGEAHFPRLAQIDKALAEVEVK